MGSNKVHLKGNLYKIKMPSRGTFRYAIKKSDGKFKFISFSSARSRGARMKPPKMRKTTKRRRRRRRSSYRK